MSSALPGSWWPNWLQGEPQDDEPPIPVLQIKGFEPRVLRGEAALTRRIYDQDHSILVVAHWDRLAAQAGCAELVKRVHETLPLVSRTLGACAHLSGQLSCHIEQFPAVFEAVQEALRNSCQTGLGTGKRPCKNGARLILATAVHRVKNGGLEVVGKTRRQIVGRRKLVIGRARQAIHQRDLPGRFDANSGINRCPGD